jgi:dTDP-glucose 4,6-dehydratase
MDTTYLIIEGSNFIGCHLIRAILDRDPEATILNLEANPNASRLAGVAGAGYDRVHSFRGRTDDPAFVDPIMAEWRPAYIVNLACLSPAPGACDPAVSTRRLLEAARLWPVQRLLLASSASVYGESHRRYGERQSPSPRTVAAAACVASENYAIAYYNEYRIPAIVTRGCAVHGPYQDPVQQPAHVITRLLQDQVAVVAGNGCEVDDWVSVFAYCQMLYFVLTRGVPGEIYNIARENPVDRKSFMMTLASILGKPGTLIQFRSERRSASGGALDTAKLAALGWVQPVLSVYDSLCATVQWHIDHEEWWRPLTMTGLYRQYIDDLNRPAPVAAAT